MDIRVANTYNAYSVYNNKTNAVKLGDKNAKADARKDAFTLSTLAEDYQAVRKVLVNVPDVRADRISQVIAKLESAGYQVSASEIADKILQDLDN